MKLNTKAFISYFLILSMILSAMVSKSQLIMANTNASTEVSTIADNNLFASYTTDLAIGKNGYASSNERQNKNYPVKVGNLTNGSTTGTNYIITHNQDSNPWFCVDLGSSQDINKVVAYQGADSNTYPNAYSTDYVIEYSTYTGNLGGETTDENAAYIQNDMVWNTAAVVSNAKLGANTTVFESVNTRYVRVRATTKYTTWTSMYEMYVYATDFSNPYDDTETSTETTRILFIGNSLTEYNDVAGKVQAIFAHEGKEVEWDKLIQLGKTLEYHYSLAETGTTILNGNYDYIVLQDKASGFDGDTLMSGVTLLYDSYISKTDAKIVMYSPWANKSVLKSTQDYFTSSYMAVATKYNAPIAPAGEAWFDLYYNYGYDWYSDNIHATNVGSFVSANSIYYAISGAENPVTYKSNDSIIQTNNYDVNIANLIAQRTFYYTTLANKDTASYVSIAKDFVEPETTAETPTEEVTTLVPEGEKTTGTAVNSSVFSSSANIAKGKTAYASSTMQAAANAVDGNTGTRWESEYADPQWIYIDLGQSYSISKVAFMWEGAYAKKYHVQISDIGGTDSANWTTVKTVTATAVTTVEIDMKGSTGRYVRMIGETRGTQYGYSIYEFGVWAGEVEEETTTQETTTQIEETTEEITTQAEGNQYYDAEGQVKDDEILGIEGFQIKTAYDENGNASPGFRVIERVGQSSVDGQRVIANGLLLVRADKYNRELMITDEGDISGEDLSESKLNENNVLVVVASAAPIEWTNATHDDSDAHYNAFTMVNNISQDNVEESLTNEYYVRAFAQLADGRIIYSKIYKSSIYSAADSLYKNQKMSNNTAHEYLFNEILKVVTPDYSQVDYNWSNILHKPEAEK